MLLNSYSDSNIQEARRCLFSAGFNHLITKQHKWMTEGIIPTAAEKQSIVAMCTLPATASALAGLFLLDERGLE